jgi:hypothetical protein
MVEFFRNGGFGMFPVLVLGMLTLAAGGHFAMRAERKTRNFVDVMVKVVLFSACAGLLTNLAATFDYLAHKDVPADKFSTTLAEGLYESLGPAIMGSAFLALTFLFVAIGQRRLDARTATA